MTLRKALVLVAVACLLAVSASANTPSPQAGVGGSADFTLPEGPIVLYDQTDSAAGNGIPDQDFEAGFDAYDCEGADDFDVDFGDGWDIDQVNTIGTTGTPGGALVDVNVYTDNGGTPLGGTNICSYDDVAPTLDNLGSLTVDLPATCSVPFGLHWVAIQVNQNFGTFGQHFWSNRSVQSNNESVWRNPGGGFGLGCTDWDAQTTCGVGGGASPDLLFSLVGALGQPQDTDVSIEKSGELVGSNVIFTVTVTNNGPIDATGVTVEDTLQAPFVSDDCGGVDGDPWTWAVGNLMVGDSAVCNITVDVSGFSPGDTLENQASVAIDQNNTDPDGGTSDIVNVPLGTVLDVPTLGQFGLVALLLSIIGAGVYRLRRRQS